jgi:hypothetical protein
MLSLRRLVLVLTLALVAAACGDTAPGAGDGPSGTAADGGATSGAAVDGVLTVADAVAGDATGTIAVEGYLFGDETGWRLCEVLAESFPPQCGGAALLLGDFDRSLVADDGTTALQENQGITWSESYVALRGEIVEGTLLVDAGG